MKKINYFKAALLQVTFIIAILFTASCNNSQKPDDSKEVAEDQNDETFDTRKQEKDAQFLVNAAETNLKEIQLGQLAQNKGNSAHVKALGKMMEEAHNNSQQELAQLANRKAITIPTSLTDDALDAYNKLNEKSGNDFDKAYSDLMVSAHNDAISDFEKATTDAYDNDIKNWASASLPNLRTHLNHAIDSQKKSDKM